jgi:hypothetical protein
MCRVLVRLLAVLLFGRACVGVLAAAHADSATGGLRPSDMQPVARAIANDLLPDIAALASPGAPLPRVAVRPFRVDEIDIPDDAAAALNDAVEAALAAGGHHGITLMDREGLQNIFDEASEFQGADLSALIRQAGGDVLVRGEIHAVQGGLLLTYKADDVRAGHVGQMVARTPEPRFLAGDFVASALPLQQALRGAARTLAERIAARVAAGGASDATFPRAPDVTDLADYILHDFLDALETQWPPARQRALGARPVTGERGAPAPTPTVTIGVTMVDAGPWLEAHFTADTEGGAAGAVATARIAKDSPPGLLAALRDADGLRRATGEALLASMPDRIAALRAARALARARLLGLDGAVRGVAPARIAGIADAMWALGAIEGGVTYDEHWAPDEDIAGGAAVRVTLRARVQRLDDPDAPVVRATAKPVIAAGQNFSFTLRSDRRANVGVFAWLSDDSVLRVYPYRDFGPLVVQPGRPRTLPEPREQPIRQETRDNLPADFEALIVVSSVTPLDYDCLAGEPGIDEKQSLLNAVPIGAFFAALARQRAPIRIQVLPYEIRRP